MSLVIALSLLAGSLRVGQIAPPLIGVPMNGQPFQISQFKGRAVVIEFWATWCAPCVAAQPHMNQLAAKFRGKPIEFIAVTIDQGKQARAVVAKFLNGHPLDSRVLLATGGTQESYGITEIPTTVLVDRRGRVAAITNPEDVNEAVLDRLASGGELAGMLRRETPITIKKPPVEAGVLSLSVGRSTEPYMLSSSTPGATDLVGLDARSVLAYLYGLPPTRVDGDAPLLNAKWDIHARYPESLRDQVLGTCRDLVPTAIALKVELVEVEQEVYVLRCPDGPRNDVTVLSDYNGGSHESTAQNAAGGVNLSAKDLANQLESILEKPVVDESGLSARLQWSFTYKDRTSVVDTLKRSGIELSLEKRKIKIVRASRRPS
jgi:uncharacterized protein (TIGR03435 family)